MNSYRRFVEKLTRRLPLLVLLFCVLQPLLDVIGYWQQVWGLSNLPTMLVRLCLLLIGLLLGFAVTDRKWLYFSLAALLLCYLSGHICACVQNGGYLNWEQDLTDQARTLVLPVTALSMISLLRKNPDCFGALKKGLMLDLGIILAVELLSLVTGTDPHTYEEKGIGLRGWFIWTSPQSAILSILAPLAVAWALERWPDRILPVTGAALLSFGALYFYGTRLAYLSLAAAGLGMAAAILLSDRRRWRQALAVFLCAGLFCALYPVSPMQRNRSAVEANAKIKQERVSAAAARFGVEGDEIHTENSEALSAAYHYNLQGMVDTFGLERVAERYHNTLKADQICDDRLMKLNYCSLAMEDAARNTGLAPLFGLEIARTRVEQTQVYRFETDDWATEAESYDPENDFYGVRYLCGWAGLLLLGALLLWIGLRALLALATRWKTTFSPTYAAWLGAFAIAVAYAFGTASVLRRNNASVYLAVVLAGLWHLSRCSAKKE